MVSSGYEEIEHTADIALRVWGEDFFTLLRQSAKGMYDLMGVEPNLANPKETRFRIEKGSRELQLVDFLNEILYLAEAKKQIFEDLSFRNCEEGFQVQASGHVLDSIRRNIKAVTFHDLEVVENKSGIEAKITFDV